MKKHKEKMNNGKKTHLPEGWKMRRLGEVCSFQNGFAFKSKTFKEKGTPIIRIKNIKNEQVDLADVVYIDQKDYEKNLTKYEIKKGDLLIAMSGATTGKIGIYNSNIISLLNQRVGKFEPHKKLLKKYLFFFLKTKVEESLKISLGAAQPNLSTEQIKNFEIPIPPLPEQKRIVAILDKAFQAIDQAKAHAEQNLKNAKEVFESYLNRIFEKGKEEIASGEWEEKPLKELSKIDYGYTEKAKFENIGPKFLRITDIQNNNVDWNSVPYCKCSNEDFAKYKLEKGDIVFARTGATTGKSYLIKQPPPAVFASYLIRLKLINKGKFVPDFLMYFFNSKFYWNKINSGISGSAQGGFNATKLGNMNIIFPKSYATQKQIVAQLDELQANTQKLEELYRQKIVNLEELKKSILEKAFRGEL